MSANLFIAVFGCCTFLKIKSFKYSIFTEFILYTDKTSEKTVTVPEFKGLTANEANTAAAKAGVNIEFSGNMTTSGLKAYNQSIKKGTKVDAGTVVTVYFRDESTVDG